MRSLLSTGTVSISVQLNSHIDTSMTYCHLIIQALRIMGQMYPADLEIKDTTESNTSASYLDLTLSFERDGQVGSSLYDKT